MRVVYCQFSTVANNVGVRIWDAKPDHYPKLLTQFNVVKKLFVKTTVHWRRITKMTMMLRVV